MVNQAREKGEEVVDKAEGVARDVKGDVEKRLG